MGFADIFAFLGGLFGSDGASGSEAATAAINQLQAEVCGLGTALAFSDNFVGAWLSAIKNALSNIWQWIFQHIILTIVYWEGVLERFLKPYVQAITRIIRDVVTLLRYYYLKFFGPILKLISILRKIVTIFRLFGFGWAKRLDTVLAQIQSDITRTFQKVVSEINHLSSYVALILNPDGLFNSNIFLASLARDCQQVFQIQWGWNQTAISGAPLQARQALNAAITTDGASADLQSLAGGTIPDYYQAVIDQSNQAFSDLGFEVPS